MKNRKQFNWFVFLNNAITQQPDSAQRADATRRARKWPTCAVGQLCAALPRCAFGTPEDWKLESWGVDFMCEVEQGFWRRALRTMEKIERRSIRLLAKLAKDKKCSTS